MYRMCVPVRKVVANESRSNESGQRKKSKQLHIVNVIPVIGCNLDKCQPLFNAVNSMNHTIQPLLSLIGECKHCS